MKKIIKYSNEKEGLSNNDKLKAYKVQAESILKGHNESALRSKSLSPLAAIVPLVAVALTPIGLNAQCGNALFPSGSNVHDSNDAGFMEIDVDGNGTVDFELEVQTDTLILHPQAGAEVIAYASGAYDYVTNFAAGAVISSANTGWVSGIATLEYDGTEGGWGGTGVQTGYIGIRLDGNRLGFIEVVWDADGGVDVATVTTAATGVTTDANAANTTSFKAGECLALPVKLIDFNANSRDGQTILNWSTATEINNTGFEIQRSTDGSDFRKIGWIQGEGNSSRQLSYEYVDKSIANNVEYYYRLKQVDVDGRFEYSDVVTAINRDVSKFMLHEIFPNPTNGSIVTIDVTSVSKGELALEVFDAVGKVVLQQNMAITEGRNTLELNVNDVANGSYFVKVGSIDFTAYKKLVIAK